MIDLASYRKSGNAPRPAAAGDGAGRRDVLTRTAAEALPWLLLAVGAILRVAQFASGRSLWVDEALIALNVVNRPFAQLLQPLDYNQVAPVGFLLIQKLCVEVFGNSEQALRLPALLAGVSSLFAFRALARRCLDPVGAVFAVGLFALAPQLIDFSAEAKHYSSDVLIALLLLLSGLGLWDSPPTWRRASGFGALGALAVWISYPAVFVLAGVGAGLLAAHLIARRNGAAVARLAVACGLPWVVSFAACYWFFLRPASANEGLSSSWGGRAAFMPFPPRSPGDLHWFRLTADALLDDPLGLPYYVRGIALLFLLVGVLALWYERRTVLALLAGPVLFTLVASGLQKYPFQSRLLLFLVPVFFVFLGAGVEQLLRRAAAKPLRAAGAVCALLLLVPYLVYGLRGLTVPRTRQEIKPVMDYLRAHRRPGDVVYLYYGGQYAFAYYADRYGFAVPEVSKTGWWAPEREARASRRAADRAHWEEGPGYALLVGGAARQNPESYRREVDQLRGKARVWVLFAHAWPAGTVREQKEILARLDAVGVRKDRFVRHGAAVFLYDLRAGAPATANR